jgi:hypothetical protein
MTFPDLMPLHFCLRGHVKDTVYIPPLPTTLHQLYAWITDAVAQVYADMLRQIWYEIAYWWDICRVTRGSHIEQL